MPAPEAPRSGLSRRGFLRTATATAALAAGATAGLVPALPAGAANRRAQAPAAAMAVDAAPAPGTVHWFLGACQGPGSTDGIPSLGGGWDRTDVFWGAAQPADAPISADYLAGLQESWSTAAANGVTVLPILNSTAGWAARTTAYSYQFGANTYDVGPVLGTSGNSFTRLVTVTDTATGAVVSSGNQELPIGATPPADPAQWTAFVTAVVQALRAVGVVYFQVWNEAWPESGFWYGGMTDYLETVHRPAAQVIRANGGKVVWGGWPADAGVQNYVDLLTEQNAWDDVDVYDLHYYQPADLEVIRAAAPANHPEPAIWQSELGWTTDQSTVSRVYPRVLRWALDHGLSTDPDHHKLFWYAWGGTDSLCLHGASGPTPHGASVQTLAALLPGTITPFTGFGTDPQTGFDLATDHASVEGFAVGDNGIVLAVHQVNPDEPVDLTVTFDSVPATATATRVSILGATEPVSWTAPGVLSVPIGDPDEASAAINHAAPTTTFYLRITW